MLVKKVFLVKTNNKLLSSAYEICKIFLCHIFTAYEIEVNLLMILIVKFLLINI
jgi:hypothetical protein